MHYTTLCTYKNWFESIILVVGWWGVKKALFSGGGQKLFEKHCPTVCWTPLGFSLAHFITLLYPALLFNISTWPPVSVCKKKKIFLLGKPFINIYGKPFGLFFPFHNKHKLVFLIFPYPCFQYVELHILWRFFWEILFYRALVDTMRSKLIFLF